ncbi:hypothetical protein BGX34_003754 [Mortierella sp. NVP85]|nr:hypothetical protein BGX34_003754 [Mortierella sp. NVP85]
MASPTQVDAILLERLTHQGPEAGRDIYVHNATANSSSTCEGTCTSESASTQDSSSTKTKLAFQPHQRYYLEGRVIHKRKLSRKLFFLDVSLVRRKQTSVQADEAHSNVPRSTLTPASDGLELSAWEDVEPRHRSTDDSAQSTHANIMPYYRMEVIARYPVHTLNGLDDLWRRVQLGSVVKVYGDIELSERNQDDNEEQGQNHRWSVLLHCLAFDVLELWQGKEGFEANPGSSEFKSQNTGSRMQRRKRKSGEISTSSSSNGSESKSSLGQEQQTRGDDSQPHCKFWLNSGKCNKEQCLFWHETDLVKLKAERRRWVEERIQAKRQISHHASDPHQHTTKNQHRERALYFAHWLIQTFTREFLNSGSGVLDIAGGRGDLSWELQTRQGVQSTIVEPRPGKGMRKWQRKWLQRFKATTRTVSLEDGHAESESAMETNGDAKALSSQGADDPDDPDEQEPDAGKDLEDLGDFIPTTLTYPLQTTEPNRIQALLDDQFLTSHQDLVSKSSILVGLHPDQATEPIVKAALKTGKPFAVIPCCVFGRDNPHRRLLKSLLSTTTNDGVQWTQTETVTIVEDDDPLTRPVTSYDDFVLWLSSLHPDIETAWLNFEGMNRVLFWRGSPPSLTGPLE